MRIMRKDILPFLGFFLMTIGNGKYLGAKCGDLIEYLGIAVLLILCYWPTKTHHISVTKIIKVLFLTSLLSIGAFIKGTPTKACYMIALTSFALMSFSLMSQSILSTNKRIKIAASAIFSGAVFSALIGLITGTLGFTLGSDESIVGILYVSGFQVKNYCGGIWLLLFILNYIYYIRNGRLGYKEKIVLTMFLFLIVLSGSKGALALSLIWILLINFDRILKFRKNQKGEDLYDIEATIYCLRNSHKGIIIGKEGKMLKRIGQAARIDMEANFGTKVNLKTWVKVKEDWQDDSAIVKKFKLQ